MGIQKLFYEALNVPMRALLRSPLHAVGSRNLCLLVYTGRRSGRRFETPLSYVRDGSRVLLLSSVDTRWWTNFLPDAGAVGSGTAGSTGSTGERETGRAVEVLAAGEWLRGRAGTIQHDRERLLASARLFLTALPRDARIYGVGLDADRRPREADLARALTRLVMVEVELVV